MVYNVKVMSPDNAQRVNNLFNVNYGNVRLGEHIGEAVRSGNRVECENYYYIFSEIIDELTFQNAGMVAEGVQPGLFCAMLSDQGAFLDFSDSETVRTLADRLIVNGRPYSEQMQITDENCRYALLDMAVLSKMALSGYENSPVVGFTEANAHPIDFSVDDSELYPREVEKPGVFKRLMNKLFGAFKKDPQMVAYKTYMEEVKAAEAFSQRAEANFGRCRDAGQTYADRYRSEQQRAEQAEREKQDQIKLEADVKRDKQLDENEIRIAVTKVIEEISISDKIEQYNASQLVTALKDVQDGVANDYQKKLVHTYIEKRMTLADALNEQSYDIDLPQVKGRPDGAVAMDFDEVTTEEKGTLAAVLNASPALDNTAVAKDAPQLGGK